MPWSMLAALGLWAAAALAQPPPPTRCVHLLREANVVRLAWAEAAASRSHAEPVRALGERLARDHRALDEAVVQYARVRGLPLREVAPPSQPFGALEGPRFDAAFLAAVDRHSRAMTGGVAGCLDETWDAKLRRLLNKALATYRDHLREVDRVYRELLPVT